MTNFHEEETPPAALYNQDVLGLLFKYILRYRKYLFASVLFVFVITAVTLTVPYLSQTVIDHLIIKQGLEANLTVPAAASEEKLVLKQLKKGFNLDNNNYFIFQSALSRFSQKEITRLKKEGILSERKYILVTSPETNQTLNEKIQKAAGNGEIKIFPKGMLVTETFQRSLDISELFALRHADIRKIFILVAVVAALFILQFGASYLQITNLMKLSQKAMRDLRIDLFQHIISLELSFFDRNPVGRLVNRVTNDIESLNELFSSVLITVFQDILIMSGVVIIMFLTDTRLALVVSLTFIPLVTATVIFRAQARKAYRVIRTRLADLNAFLNERISGIRIIQIFCQEQKQHYKFSQINNSVYRANMRQIYIYAIFRPMTDFFRWVAVASIIYLGANLILHEQMSYGLILMFIAYIGNFFEPIGDLAEKFDLMQSATAAGEKILSVFKTDAGSEFESSNIIHKNRFTGEVVFDNVWFSYVPGEWVLKGISFSIKPRTTLAIVGETGSGKSTIINLLGRFYPLGKGSILIDGKDIREIPIETLRQQMAVVMQEMFLFSRSLKENITLGNNFDSDRFKRISQMTHIDRFLNSFKNGIDEQVMERGVTFSSGERQLLAFARALYNDPSILILDEATSNIDTETERLVQDAISQVVKGRTSIVIAHRLSTVRHADRIIVIDKGQIAEEGNHKSLMAEKGLYYDLYRLQFAD
jgi:ATP-binding cassette subfamily B multidrug efflux pump